MLIPSCWKRLPATLRAAALLGCSVAVFGQTATLSLAPATGTKGSAVNLPLTFTSNGAQAAGVQWTFSFAPGDFTGVSVAAGPSASGAGKTVQCNSAGSGKYTCLVSGLNSTAISTGAIATASFNVSSTTSSTSSAIGVASAAAASGAAAALPITASGTTVTINNPVVTPKLSAFSCAPTSLTGPGSTQCTVTLTAPAPSGGAVVSIGTTSSAATVSAPASVTVAAGATTAQFAVQIGAVTANSSVQISVSLNSSTLTSVISVSPAPAVTVAVSPAAVTLGPGAKQQFTAKVTGTSNTSVTWSLSPAVGSISTAGLYTAPASVTVKQTLTVRATSAADTTKYGTATVVLNPPVTPISFWPATATPAYPSTPDKKAVELGLKFSSSVAGSVTGVRFYKGPKNTGTHIGHLWSATGTLLATVTFTGETASGWQQANFSPAVSINANTVYVISYFAPNGGYSANLRYAWSGLNAAPLSVSGSSPGTYAYGATSGFPTKTQSAANFWVDVVFQP